MESECDYYQIMSVLGTLNGVCACLIKRFQKKKWMKQIEQKKKFYKPETTFLKGNIQVKVLKRSICLLNLHSF